MEITMVRRMGLLGFAALLGNLAAATGNASPIPPTPFDWNPQPLGLHGSKFTADTARLADYGQIVVNPVTDTFSESGYLQFLGFALGGQSISPRGFNTPYGWGAFVKYQATGIQTVTSSGIVATYLSLSYSLYGFNNGSTLASYGLDPTTGAAYESGGTHMTLLGNGSLIDGSITLVPTAFEGGAPVQFAANGDIQATIANVPHQFSSDTFFGFDVDIVHLPGELFALSQTTFEADGGSSSTATFIASSGYSGYADPPVRVPEPESGLLLAMGLVPIWISRHRRS
jgi:hypothetical protein